MAKKFLNLESSQKCTCTVSYGYVNYFSLLLPCHANHGGTARRGRRAHLVDLNAANRISKGLSNQKWRVVLGTHCEVHYALPFLTGSSYSDASRWIEYRELERWIQFSQTNSTVFDALDVDERNMPPWETALQLNETVGRVLVQHKLVPASLTIITSDKTLPRPLNVIVRSRDPAIHANSPFVYRQL
ncbi:hypothetical protein J6590_020194 [Homalodisca vitripennis]|nr:hypothetical protein J6590_020194 [Homalodisca vitripennis]